MKKSVVKIYTDGACEPNPGEGGWAFCISDYEYRSGYSPRTTNNRMEMLAILKAIKYAKRKYPKAKIIIYSDSQYCVKGFNRWSLSWKKRGWKRRDGKIKNLEMWKSLDKLRKNVTLKWVKGHSGIYLNELADKIAVIEIQQKGKDLCNPL